VLLDQVVLEEQGLLLVGHHHGLDGREQLAQEAGGHEVALVAARAEVLPDPGPQVLGLADVDDLAGGVLHHVDAGIGRQPIEERGDVEHGVSLTAGAGCRRR
jgi:hypothetical protein